MFYCCPLFGLLASILFGAQFRLLVLLSRSNAKRRPLSLSSLILRAAALKK